MSIPTSSARADLFVTATGNVNVVGKEAIARLKDGAILANAGHFNDEIDLSTLASLASGCRELRPLVNEYRLPDGRSVIVLAEGHPPAVMDMSFANQALAIEYLVKSAKSLAPQVYPVPRELDEQIARRKLEAMGMDIDTMSEEQRVYSNSWKAGT